MNRACVVSRNQPTVESLVGHPAAAVLSGFVAGIVCVFEGKVKHNGNEVKLTQMKLLLQNQQQQ